jgi:hypothetical protein
MKKLVAALLVAFTVSTASVSFAATPKTLDQATTGPATSVTFAQVEKSKLDVVVENPAHAKMTIYLTDASGKSFAVKPYPAGKPIPGYVLTWPGWPVACTT